jgi:hypothetical protein
MSFLLCRPNDRSCQYAKCLIRWMFHDADAIDIDSLDNILRIPR